MARPVECVICGPRYDGAATHATDLDGLVTWTCDTCGTYSHPASEQAEIMGWIKALPRTTRAALAHATWAATDAGSPYHFERASLERLTDGLSLPNPAQQADNLILYIGDQYQKRNASTDIYGKVRVVTGILDHASMDALLGELQSDGLILREDGMGGAILYRLSLKGWNHFEDVSRRAAQSNTGFIALNFDPDPNAALERLVRDTLKPGIKTRLGFDLRDARDNARAGVIDVIMRAQIRDARFVIADLSHDNQGAYWEAGYAEGLGKPVIYICEKTKFEQVGTHFDTRNLQTITWDAGAEDDFLEQVVASLRLSLNLFPTEARHG